MRLSTFLWFLYQLKKDLPGVIVDCSSLSQVRLEKMNHTQVEHTWKFDVRIQASRSFLFGSPKGKASLLF